MERDEIKKLIEKVQKNSIKLTIGESLEPECCETHFGGRPDVPSDFHWPTYTETKISGVTYPLTFLAQFNCEDLQQFDLDGYLPKTGLLSFFYDTEGQPWGFKEAEKGAARVFWFEDLENLKPAEFPEDLSDESCFPCLDITAQIEKSYLGWEDASLFLGEMTREKISQYCDILEELGYQTDYEKSKMLGWPDVVQDNMTETCEAMISKEKAKGSATLDKWQLLFQLSTILQDDFELLFGDCGIIYFYIRKGDLINRNFDDVWLMLQC